MFKYLFFNGQRLFVRENLRHGGELSVNIRCAGPATAAGYQADEANGEEPVPGFGHSDCAPFSGDAARWIPEWKGGLLNGLTGQGLVFELCFSGGEVDSLSGNCTPMMFVEARKCERFGTIPDRRGW